MASCSVSNETMNEDDQLYQVEKIVDKHVELHNNIEKFKIRWVGYTKDGDTWASEEDSLPDCYYLISHYERSRFIKEMKRNKIPEVMWIRKVHNQIKLLVKWPEINQPEFFYSSVIQSVDPSFLVNLYEKFITETPVLNSEWTHFILNTKVKNVQIYENDEPQKILSVVRCLDEKVCLVHWKQSQEATIVEHDFIKLNHPKLLIEFYERHLKPM